MPSFSPPSLTPRPRKGPPRETLILHQISASRANAHQLLGHFPFVPPTAKCGRLWDSALGPLLDVCSPLGAVTHATLRMTSHTGDLTYWYQNAHVSKIQPLPVEVSRASQIYHGHNHTSDIPSKSALPTSLPISVKSNSTLQLLRPGTLELSLTFLVHIPRLALMAPPPQLSTF